MWRNLIQTTMEQDIARKRANPGVQNFGALVKAAMEMGIKQKEESREEARTGRTAARTAVYNKYPQMAAQDLGMDTSTMAKPGEIPAGPPGTVLDKVQYDEQGNPTTVYTNPVANQPTPSWGQHQKVQALKTGLRMGKVVIGKEFGEPSVYETKTMEEALRAIQDAGLDPSLLSEELKLYDVVERRLDKKSKRQMAMLRDGRIIWEDTKELIK